MASLDRLKSNREVLAPEFQDIKGWINSPPLTMSSLRGKIVFLDFWTFGCINCINTRPHFRRLYELHKDNPNFVIIGVHTPEFDFEKDATKVRKAVEKYNLRYPIALDSDNSTWKAYGNQYWPRQTIVDSRGIIRYEHVGEGAYTEMEQKVAELLNEVK
jgi:thiol-disulfide isomerase/thioredoxin